MSLITWEGPCAFPVTLYIPYLLGIICRPFLQYSISLSLRHSRAFMLVLVSFLCTYVVQTFLFQEGFLFLFLDCFTNISKIFENLFNEMKQLLYESNQKGKKSINTLLSGLYSHQFYFSHHMIYFFPLNVVILLRNYSTKNITLCIEFSVSHHFSYRPTTNSKLLHI